MIDLVNMINDLVNMINDLVNMINDHVVRSLIMFIVWIIKYHASRIMHHVSCIVVNMMTGPP